MTSEDLITMQEFAGYCLLPNYSIQKAVLLQGDGDNGKSTYLNLLKTFVGEENCSHVSWQSLEDNRFASSQLEGKLINMFADLPSKGIDVTTTFKTLTGGDQVESEKKFLSGYSFKNFAKIIFSANKPPEIKTENSFAFWRRWILIEFPNQITEEKKDPNILDKITTSEELSGFLNYALEGLKRLTENKKFTYNKTIEEVTETYQIISDPVHAFVFDMCDIGADNTISKDELYDAYVSYARSNKLPIMKPNSFTRAIKNQSGLHANIVRPINSKGERYYAWQGLSLHDVQLSADVQLSMDKNLDTKETSTQPNEDNENQENPVHDVQLSDEI